MFNSIGRHCIVLQKLLFVYKHQDPPWKKKKNNNEKHHIALNNNSDGFQLFFFPSSFLFEIYIHFFLSRQN